MKGLIYILNLVRKQKILFLIISVAVVYAVQFLLLPNFLPQYYPVSNEAWLIFIVPLVVFSVVMNILIDVNIGIWIIVDILYGIMMGVYNGRGFYGIGMRGVSLDGMSPSYSLELALITILIIILTLFAFQLLMCVLRVIFLKMKNNKI